MVGDQARIERVSPSAALAGRVAVIAHWSGRAQVSRSVCTLVREFQSFGYVVVVSSACETPDDLVWDTSVCTDELVVIRKRNVGYDFGSWSVALRLIPEIAQSGRVIIANDSMTGPFVTLRPLLERFESTSADVWGLTDSQQFEPHLQSYLLGFRGGVLADRTLRAFWDGVRDLPDKQEVIFKYEIGLSRLLREEGYVQVPAFSQELFVQPGQNPVIVGWKRLLERGFPFLKREILRDPTVAPDGETAPTVVSRLLGIDVAEWVDHVGGNER
jgi:lipopolysaccharide biosynthesis protein